MALPLLRDIPPTACVANSRNLCKMFLRGSAFVYPICQNSEYELSGVLANGMKLKMKPHLSLLPFSLPLCPRQFALERLWSAPSFKDIAMRTDQLDSNYIYRENKLRVRMMDQLV